VLKSSRYELLVFDWDGTLSDSLQLIIESVRRAILDLGLPQRSERSIRGIIGLGLNDASNRLFPGMSERDCRRLGDCYRTHYRELAADPVPLYPGTREVVAALHAAGYTLAIATGKSRRGLNLALADSGLSCYFQESRCADETFSKPHPQMLEELIDTTGTVPERALMIGDSEHDLQMASNAGVDSVAVTHGAQSAAHLLQFKPLACFAALEEFPPWLEGANSEQPTVIDNPAPRP
jgi:phosphoglycolate phosphatase